MVLPVMTLAPVMLPPDPLISKLPNVPLPVALIKPAVKMLPAVTLPDADISPETYSPVVVQTTTLLTPPTLAAILPLA